MTVLGDIWCGVVRGVNISATLPGPDASGFSLRQIISVERHTRHIVEPDTSEPLVLVSPVPDQIAPVGAAYSFDLTPYRSGGKPPYAWAMRAGTLPTAVVISGETLAGVPASAGVITGLRLRVADSAGRSLDTPEFSFSAGEVDPLWAQVRLLVGANEPAGSLPSDMGPLAATRSVVGSAPVTGAAASSFTGAALAWTAGNGYLKFSRSGGFFNTPGASFTFEVWADLDAINSPGAYVNFRNVFAALRDEVTPGNLAVMSGGGFGTTQMTLGAAATTGVIMSLNTGQAAGQGITRLTRNHCVVQYNAVTGRALYFVNGYKFAHETVGPHSRNPTAAYFGNVGTGSSYTTAGSAEWMRLTEGLRYPEVAMDDGTFPSNGDKCFDPPSGPFPTIGAP